MKTVSQIQKEIKEASESSRTIRVSAPKADIRRIERYNKAIQRRIELLRQCELYIKTNPRLEYLKSTETDLEEKIAAINSHYHLWHGCNMVAYRSLMGVPLLKQQLETIRYLIDE